jgi:hypothetical protein
MAFIALPLQHTHSADYLASDPAVFGASHRRQRFPRAATARGWLLRWGPSTFADLDTNAMAAIRTAKGGALIVSLAIPGVGTVSGRYGQHEWRSDSPTAVYLEVPFIEEPRI